jgi:hypothetical protein
MDMNDIVLTPETWATAIRFADRVKRGCPTLSAECSPPMLVQRVTQNVVLSGGPCESFSQRMPVWIPPTTAPRQDHLPIDVLYGTYSPGERKITEYIKRIQSDARMFGAEPNELLEIVRVHEYAHAIVHLGIRTDDELKALEKEAADDATAWADFLGQRTAWFVAQSRELHEFLAQAITFSALATMAGTPRGDKLLKVYDALESRQPDEYQLSAREKAAAPSAMWPLLLDVARGDTSVYWDDSFTIREALEALVCATREAG